MNTTTRGRKRVRIYCTSFATAFMARKSIAISRRLKNFACIRRIIPGSIGPPMPRYHPAGLLPTIGETRAEGISRIRVYCIQGCGPAGMVEMDRLGMPDELPFVHIPAQRRLVCTGCGGRNVQVMPNWPRVPGAAYPLE
jgi:hypothetical protein